MSITFYRGIRRDRFTAASEPTIEGQAGTDSLSQSIAAGNAVPDLMDGNRQTLLTTSFDTSAVTDGGFDDASAWNVPAGWYISGSKANLDTGGGGGAADLSQANALVMGTLYSVSFTLADYLSGDVTVKLGTSVGTTRSANGVYTESITATGNSTFTLAGSNLAELTIDSLSVKPLDLRFDLAAGERVDADCLILDNVNFWDSLPSAVRKVVDIYSHSSDDFTAATQLAPTKIYGGLLGRKRPYLDFDGSDDVVTVADDANLDWGRGNGAVEIIVEMPDVSDTVQLIQRHQGSGDRWYFIYNQTAGTLVLDFAVGGSWVHRVACNWTPAAKTRYHLMWVFENGVSNAFYIDGVSQSLTTDTSVSGTFDIVAAMEFAKQDTGNYGNVNVMLVRLWNRAPSTSEVTDLNNSVPVAAADQWGSQTNLVTNGDFASDTAWVKGSGWTITGGKAVATSAPNNSDLAQTSLSTTSGKKYRITVTISDYAEGTVRGFLGDSFVSFPQSNGTHSIEVQPTSGTVTNLLFRCVGTTTLKLDDASVNQIGCVAEYAPDCISKSGGKWYDSSSNDLDGTITGADYRYAPYSEEKGFLLYEFTKVNAQYWFVEINPDDLIATENLVMGQMVIGKSFTPTASPDLNSPFGAGSGTSISLSYGGHKFVRQRFAPRHVRQLAWSYLTEEDRTGFEEMFEDVGVAETGPSLFPVYYTEARAADDPILHPARIMGKPEFTEVAYGAYALSLVLEDEV